MMVTTKKLRFSLFAAAGIFAAVPGSALAQDTPPAPAEGADTGEPADPEAAVEDEEGEVIIITGTTIARKETTTPAPVAIVTREDLAASGMVSVGEILQNIPAQSNAI